MYFGKRRENLCTPPLSGKPLEWVSSWDYLGVNVQTGCRFSCSMMDRIEIFYRCTNAIFRIEGRSDDLVMLRLVECHCIPILTYGMEIYKISDNAEKSKIRAACNSIFRKIFGYRKYESVTNLQLSLARPTWEMCIERPKLMFYERLAACTL